MKVKIDELRKLAEKILTNKYFSASQAKKMAEVLLYAELSGKDTQGIIKFFGNEPIQNTIPKYKPKIVKDTKLSVLIDGGGNPGLLVGRLATKIAIDKCKKNGFALVGANNSFASSGTIGFYANEIANNDFIGIVMSGTPKGVTLYGSIDKLVGTNPIAFGFPTENDPLIFDMATSAITWYGLIRAKILGVDLPDDVAFDSNGQPTKNPEEAMKGAIRTFGNGYKGSGLNLMVEMLTGPFVGAISPDSDGIWYNGSIFIVIDPDLLIGRKNLKKNSSFVLNKIKKSRTSKGFKEVLLPGEKSLKARKKAEASGKVEIDKTLYKNLLKLIKKIADPD